MWTLYLLLILLAAVVLLVGRLIVRALWRAGPVGRSALLVGLAILGWAGYRALVPAPAAYLDEFAELSGVRLPDSTRIVERDASFPDRHGYYRACFMARLPAAELAAITARLGPAQSSGALQACRARGQAPAPGAAIVRYDLARALLGEQATVNITVDPAQGWLRAEWQVRRQLVKK